MTELAIIIATMVILVGAVIVEELQPHFLNQPKDHLVSKPSSKPSGGCSPEQLNS